MIQSAVRPFIFVKSPNKSFLRSGVDMSIDLPNGRMDEEMPKSGLIRYCCSNDSLNESANCALDFSTCALDFSTIAQISLRSSADSDLDGAALVVVAVPLPPRVAASEAFIKASLSSFLAFIKASLSSFLAGAGAAGRLILKSCSVGSSGVIDANSASGEVSGLSLPLPTNFSVSLSALTSSGDKPLNICAMLFFGGLNSGSLERAPGRARKSAH